MMDLYDMKITLQYNGAGRVTHEFEGMVNQWNLLDVVTTALKAARASQEEVIAFAASIECISENFPSESKTCNPTKN